ncbi:c-type cytochrome [Occallatibacter savannae]|uniref:c-type cytochrome n=1 Tax=Occallatibacter savannae TaxID=1002691 RepID=UPI001EF6FE26|nr:c-type cytochrome [Occallatibacter savannae]
MIRTLLGMGVAFAAGALMLPVLVLRHGLSATEPTHLETIAIEALKHKVLVAGKDEKNPLAGSPNALADGKEAFSHYCVACHGMDGQNTGVPFAERLSPPVPSLASPDVQGYSDGQLKWVIDNGIWPSGMPGSRGTLADEEIWSIVVYLRHLPPAGSLGEPEMYAH